MLLNTITVLCNTVKDCITQSGPYFLPASIIAGDGRGEERGGEKVGNSTADNIRLFKWSFCRISLLTMCCLVRSSMWQDSEALQQSHSTCSSDDCLGPVAECGGGRAG